MNKYGVWLLLIVCNLFWAGNYVFGKIVVAEMSPLWITFSRWTLALLLLFPIAQKIEKPDWRKAWQEWPALLAMGLLGVIGYNLILYSALEYTTATNAALVCAINPGIIVMFSVALYREQLSRLQNVGFLLSLIGTVIVLTNGELARLLQFNFNFGDILMIGAILVWTFYTLLGKKLKTKPITSTTLSSALAVLIMLPFALVEGIDVTRISALTVTGILYMVIFASACAFVFWNISVQKLGASQAGVFLNLIPVFTAIISAFMGESVTGAQVVGGVLVFSGVYLTTGMLDQKVAVPEEIIVD